MAKSKKTAKPVKSPVKTGEPLLSPEKKVYPHSAAKRTIKDKLLNLESMAANLDDDQLSTANVVDKMMGAAYAQVILYITQVASGQVIKATIAQRLEAAKILVQMGQPAPAPNGTGKPGRVNGRDLASLRNLKNRTISPPATTQDASPEHVLE